MKFLHCTGNRHRHQAGVSTYFHAFRCSFNVRSRYRLAIVGVSLALAGITCKDEGLRKENSLVGAQQCVLPFPVGNAYTCVQGFNGRYSHKGAFLYSVDFTMDIGTTITAARGGRVRYVQEGYLDTDQTPGHENVVIIEHDDSTYARYAHLTRNGACVTVGQAVQPGDTIALSGNSGQSMAPHVHFDVTKGSFDRWNALTVPFVFRNASPPDRELQVGVLYRALPYELPPSRASGKSNARPRGDSRRSVAFAWKFL